MTSHKGRINHIREEQTSANKQIKAIMSHELDLK